MKTPVVLQSGYLGYLSSSLELPTPESTEQKLENMKFSDVIVDETKAYHFHRGITDLYNEYRNDERIMRDFAFRQRVLEAAIDAFNTNSFFKWCSLQRNSYFLTALHKRFLNETLRYLKTGTRSISIESWISMLDVRHATSTDANIDLELISYFGLNIPSELADVIALPVSLTDTIVLWTTHDGGFNDLLIFCNTVFGFNTKVYVNGKHV